VVNSDSPDALVKRAKYLRTNNEVGGETIRRRRLAAARESLRKALEMDGENLDALIENAKVSFEAKEFDLAKEYLAKASKVDPKNVRIYLQQSLIARVEKDPESEIECVQAGLAQLPDNHQLISVLLTAQVLAKKTEQARATIERMRELNFRNELIDLSEAKVLCGEENWKVASNKLEALRPQMSLLPASFAVSVDHLLARCYQRLGKPDRQLAACERALGTNPRSQLALAGQAEALVTLRRMPAAMEALDRLRTLMGDGEFDNDKRLRTLYLGTLVALSENSPKYKKRFESYKQKYISSDDVTDSDKVVVRAEELLNSGKIDEAMEILTEALVQYPDAIRLQNLVLAILVREQSAAVALEHLVDAATRTENPWTDSPQLFMRRAELVALVGGLHQAERIKELETKIEKYEEAIQSKLWKKLARMYYHTAPPRRRDAKRCLQLAAKGDQDQVYTIGLFELEREVGNELEMQAQIDAAVERFGKDNDIPKYLQARYLLWQYDKDSEATSLLETANRLADEIALTRPRWQALLQLKGMINEHQGNVGRAIEFFEDSLDAGPMDVTVVRHLIELLAREGRFDEARKILLRLTDVPQELKKEQVTLDLLTGNREAALASLAQAAPIDSRDSEDWIRRGRVLLRLDKTVDAEKAFRRAVALAPDIPVPSLTLVEYLLTMKRDAEAEREIRMMENRFSDDVSTRVMGQSYAWLGNRMMAEHYLSAAVAEDPKDMFREQALARYHMINKRPNLAIPHLNSILENKLSAGVPMDALAVWARRSLARVLASLSNHSAFREALALLEANRNDKKFEAPDTSLKGLLLASRTEPIYRKNGLSLLESVSQDDLETDARLALAQLYFVGDRWSDCREVMQALLIDNPTDIRLLGQYVAMLIEREEWPQAEIWLRQLQERAPADNNTIRLVALSAKGRNKSQQAKEIVESLVPEGNQLADPEKVLVSARMYEELKMYTAAEDAYRALANRDIQYRLALAGYLARRGKLDESFKICDTLFTKETAVQICAIGLSAAVQHVDDLTPDQNLLIEQWIERAQREVSNPVNLLTQQASLLSARGEYQKALDLLNVVATASLNDNQRGLLANNRAYMNVRLGKAEESLEEINTAIDLLGPRVEVLDTRAMIHLSRGEHQKAIEDLKEATMFPVKSGVYFFHLALAYQAADNRPAAKEALGLAKDMQFLGDDVAPNEREQFDKLRRWLRH
jgi:tetratricopeptide (TPR) repeat protein